MVICHTFDGENDGGVVRGSKDVPSKSISVIFPAKAMVLNHSHIRKQTLKCRRFIYTHTRPISAEVIPVRIARLVDIRIVGHLREPQECMPAFDIGCKHLMFFPMHVHTLPMYHRQRPSLRVGSKGRRPV